MIISNYSTFRIIFYLHAAIAIFLTLAGPIFFVVLPMIMWNRTLEYMTRAATQNDTMVGLWIMYFAVIALLPLNYFLLKRKTDAL